MSNNDLLLMRGRGRGASSGGGGGGGEFRAHEPSGYTQLFSNPLATVPPASPAAADSYGFRTYYQGANATHSIGTDNSGGESDPSYLRVTYKAGMDGGGFDLPFTAGQGFSSGGNITELYTCLRYRMSSNWTSNGNTGTKFFFFSQRTGSGTGNNHYINLGGDDGLTPTLGIQRSGWTVGGNASENYGGGAAASKVDWHILEAQWIANTVVAGVSEAANGVARIWVDGVLWLEQTGLTFFHRSMTPGWDEFWCNPTYGGGSNPVPADQYFDIEHWYASGKA